MLMGTAMMSAMADETSVPKMNGSAPNTSLTGSQSLLTRKRQPNFCSASCEPCVSSRTMSTMRAKTTSAMTSVSHLKARSPKRDPPRVCMVAGRTGADSFTFQFFHLTHPEGRADLPVGLVARQRDPTVCLKIKRTKSGRNCALRPAHAHKTTGQRSEVSI